MSFLNRSVSPIRRSNSPVAWQCETELSDSHRHGAEEDKVYVNNNEDMETSTFPHRVANGCQEQLNCSCKENVSHGSSLMNTEEKRPTSQCQKFFHVVLLAMCFVSVASLVLTLLMLFGVVHISGTPQCACSGETGIL